MNCLNNIELQKYIDNELDANTRAAMSNHLDFCKKCTESHMELLKGIQLINESLDVLFSEPGPIPPVDQYLRKSVPKTKTPSMKILLKIAAAVLVLAVSFSVIHYYSQQHTEIPKNECIVYELMSDYDPNEQWHNNQMLVTISNANNEIEFSFIMDNND